MSLDSQTVFALTALLEDTRASVEILVELANGATEVAEREASTAMGQDAVLLCSALRERIAKAGVFVPRHINGIVLNILATERYDDRLRAFARHQAGVRERAEALADVTEDREIRAVMRDLCDAAVRGALWCEQRAATFAGSRLLVFGTPRAAIAPTPPEPFDNPGAGNAAPDIREAVTYPGDVTLPRPIPGKDVSDFDAMRGPGEPRDENPPTFYGAAHLDGAGGGER